jgi:hypothetical protein
MRDHPKADLEQKQKEAAKVTEVKRTAIFKYTPENEAKLEAFKAKMGTPLEWASLYVLFSVPPQLPPQIRLPHRPPRN